MEIPTYTFPAGTRVGMIVCFQGSYVDKTFGYRDADDNFRRGTHRSYGQPVWFWTGYRWIRFGSNNAIEAKRDILRAKAGRKVINNEWV